MFQRGGGMEVAMLSLGGAYKTETWEASARAGLHAWHLTYLYKMKDLALVAECDGNLMQVSGREKRLILWTKKEGGREERRGGREGGREGREGKTTRG